MKFRENGRNVRNVKRSVAERSLEYILYFCTESPGGEGMVVSRVVVHGGVTSGGSWWCHWWCHFRDFSHFLSNPALNTGLFNSFDSGVNSGP